LIVPVPVQPKIYHIVHIDKLASISRDGYLWSDSAMSEHQSGTSIGMEKIKQRRLLRPISCHNNLHVGECVPFYFCSRSIMLFVIHCANHSDLAYRGGQIPIIHLEADLHRSIQWAETYKKRWAFSLSNAAALYTEFRRRMDQLIEVDWHAVAATDFRPTEVQEAKQAEFLVEHSFPWHLFERIGVYSQDIVLKVADVLQGTKHRPRVEIKREWYYY
jgi:ssDNA thymidine ADP-ribosyltransferase, DarT